MIMRCLLYLVILFVITGCSYSEARHDRQLDEAQSLMSSDAEAALGQLNALDISRFEDSATMARWALLYSEAMAANGVYAPTDTISCIAVDYYTRHDDEASLARVNAARQRMASFSGDERQRLSVFTAMYFAKEREFRLYQERASKEQELAKLLKRRGYGVQIAATVAGAKEVIEKESPLFICSDLDLPDGSGLELLDMVRAADADIPFLIAYCHDPSHYEAEAVRRGVTLCLDKTRINFVADKLIEYAYRQSCGEAQPDFHKLLYVHADTADTSNGLRSGVLSEAMLQKGFYIVTAETLAGANDLLLEDDNIELILCDTTLPDGSGLDLLHSQRNLAERYGTLVKSRPLFILTDSKDLATEYQYRQESVNDYLTSPVNIPEPIRRIRYFIAPQEQIQAAE